MAAVSASPADLLHDVYGPPAASDWLTIDWRAHRAGSRSTGAGRT